MRGLEHVKGAHPAQPGGYQDIDVAMTGAPVLPARTRHRGFGDLAATWG